MTDAPRSAVEASRVRPTLRRFAIVAFAILLPIAAHSLWDYVEVRRLVHEIEAMRAKGEPASERDSVGGEEPLPTEAHGAASYYLAGAMLALGSNPYRVTAPIREWLAEPNPNRQSLQPLVIPLRRLVQESRDALILADKAAELPFTGFPAGTEYSYRTAGISALSELIAARTLSLSESGNGDAAVASVLSGLKIRRALRDARWMSINGHQVAAVLSLSQPSPQALGQLQAALEAEDRPEQPLENFLRERARYVELIWRRYYGSDPNAPRQYTLPMRSITETVMRPWFTHDAVEVLRLWAELTAVARTPWPDKAQRSTEILESHRTDQQASRQASYFSTLVNRGLAIGAFSQAIDATPLIIDRSSRIAVAVERYGRDRGNAPRALSDLVPHYMSDVPVDPFSGGPLLFRAAADAYTIYSVGPNHRDDGGDLTSELRGAVERGWGRRVIRGADVGIQVLVQH